eukprot:gnl/TRDRNA2_/TRDRNA2_188661_c0_seq1.p1 gnl/TRDRNA2_/TRDRNA2_188661_c0~~gnl/TRDRNA2_/TRDRNA2_188661_c0_seq1.p1  ORF type:complete len:510 (-),score=71.57 gnl/TRDRNA2_/TRDRNA2_188661_c0_seq1:39-1568(-)
MTSSDPPLTLAAGGSHFLAVLPNGDLFAWGANTCGQLGNGTTIDSDKPVRVLKEIRHVSAGWHHNLAINKYGEVFAWGANSNGQLGDGTFIDRHSPVKVVEGGNGDIVLYLTAGLLVAAGLDHSLCVRKNTENKRIELFAWGANTSFGTTSACRITGLSEVIYKPIKLMEDIRAIAAGKNHSLALTIGHELIVWGRNASGQLGDGTLTHKHTPFKLMDRVRSIAAGVDYSMAILDNHDLLVWGSNGQGRLGDGTGVDKRYPTKILENVVAVAAGHYHAFALLKGGDCVGWGFDKHGCIFSVSGQPVLSPQKILGDVQMVAAGGCRSLFLTNSGEYVMWGPKWIGEVVKLQALAAGEHPCIEEARLTDMATRRRKTLPQKTAKDVRARLEEIRARNGSERLRHGGRALANPPTWIDEGLRASTLYPAAAAAAAAVAMISPQNGRPGSSGSTNLRLNGTKSTGGSGMLRSTSVGRKGNKLDEFAGKDLAEVPEQFPKLESAGESLLLLGGF